MRYDGRLYFRHSAAMTKFYKDLLLNSIDLGAYNVAQVGNGITQINEFFLSDQHQEIEKLGERRAFRDWLQGFQFVLNIPLIPEDQIKLAIQANILPQNATSSEINEYRNNFYDQLTTAFFALKKVTS